MYLIIGVLVGVGSCYLLMELRMMKRVDARLANHKKHTKAINSRTLSVLKLAVNTFSNQVHLVSLKCDDAVGVCVDAFASKQHETVTQITKVMTILAPRDPESGEPPKRYKISLQKIRDKAEERTIEELGRKQESSATTE